jgi:methanogenic corrinoid protein MtbC1
MSKTIPEALADFDEDFVLEQVRQRLDEGEEPIRLVRELQEGMNRIGERFKSQQYFLSELMMSADLFAQAMKLIEPRLTGTVQQSLGKIVIGTPKGDIHDIGKTIFCNVARGAGFEVHDLGVDVPVERFLKAIAEIKPQIVAFSSLITPSFQPMKQVVDALVQKGEREKVKIIIGGGVITETVRKYVGADAQTNDALEGLDFCKNFASG